MTNLLLTVLDKAGISAEKLGDSTGLLKHPAAGGGVTARGKSPRCIRAAMHPA